MIGGKERIMVWEDTYYEHSGETLDFSVSMGGVRVYIGHAEAFPDGRPIRVYINRIVMQFLKNSDFNPTVSGLTADSTASAYFTLYDEGSSVTLGGIWIVFGFYGEAGSLLSEPVNGKADSRMHLPLSSFNSSATTININ